MEWFSMDLLNESIGLASAVIVLLEIVLKNAY